jgi:general stress protein 26
MTRANAEREHESEVDRLLAGAAKAVRNAPYCWLATAGETGRIAARPMGRLLHDPGEDEWRIRFVTDGRSRKVMDLRRQAEVLLAFQHDPSEAYVHLAGHPTVRDEASEVGRRWKPHYDAYFPSEADRASAIFVEIDVARMALWIRGVTPEPFGLRTTSLERRADGGWRLAS